MEWGKQVLSQDNLRRRKNGNFVQFCLHVCVYLIPQIGTIIIGRLYISNMYLICFDTIDDAVFCISPSVDFLCKIHRSQPNSFPNSVSV